MSGIQDSITINPVAANLTVAATALSEAMHDLTKQMAEDTLTSDIVKDIKQSFAATRKIHDTLKDLLKTLH